MLLAVCHGRTDGQGACRVVFLIGLFRRISPYDGHGKHIIEAHC